MQKKTKKTIFCLTNDALYLSDLFIWKPKPEILLKVFSHYCSYVFCFDLFSADIVPVAKKSKNSDSQQYFASMGSSQILYNEYTLNIGQDFLDIQYMN